MDGEVSREKERAHTPRIQVPGARGIGVHLGMKDHLMETDSYNLI